VGSDIRMTGQPEDVPPLARGVIPEVEQRGYRAYPLVDHVADKVAAMYERHGEDHRPSTRFRSSWGHRELALRVQLLTPR
jgi:hypothetical protein